MDNERIFMPVLVLMGLTALVWIWMYVTRIRYMRERRIHPESAKTAYVKDEVLAEIAAPSDNLRNLFELPVLFYAAAIMAHVTGTVDQVQLTLAWTFVGARVVHSAIHITYNRVVHRFVAYIVGAVVLYVFIARLAWSVASA